MESTENVNRKKCCYHICQRRVFNLKEEQKDCQTNYINKHEDFFKKIFKD